jgi:hypothetical protein
MMAHDPRDRIADYATLLERIDRLPALRPNVAGPMTAELPAAGPTAAPPGRGQIRRRVILAGITALTALALAAGAWWAGGRLREKPAGPTMVSSGWRQPLYDGATLPLVDWVHPEGEWAPARDADGGRVLSGRGAIRRRLPPLPDLRLVLGVDLHEADAIEVHFGVTPASAGSESRHVLRVARDGITLGRRTGDRGEATWLTPVRPLPALARDASPYREVRVDRQGPRWWAYFNGELLGSVPAQGSAELPEFRLVTEGSGPARFDNLEIEGLAIPPR